ncbi:MAG: hypothetical protein ACK4RN_09415 [Pseudorhodobacter sp.]
MAAVLVALVLGGCVLPGGQRGGGADISPITGPEVETSTLPPAGGEMAGEASPGTGPQVATAGAGPASEAAPPPETAPESIPEPAPEAAPPVVKSAAQIACEKLGGRFVRVGSGSAMACQRVMRDAGKSCRRKSDCEGECLARSRTCAPLSPLFGCNDILQDDGRQVSLCIN